MAAEIRQGASGFCLWNSVTSLLAPETSLSGIHRSSAAPYPFQHTKYSSFPLKNRLSRILSTSYSWIPSQMTGGGGGGVCRSGIGSWW